MFKLIKHRLGIFSLVLKAKLFSRMSLEMIEQTTTVKDAMKINGVMFAKDVVTVIYNDGAKEELAVETMRKSVLENYIMFSISTHMPFTNFNINGTPTSYGDTLSRCDSYGFTYNRSTK